MNSFKDSQGNNIPFESKHDLTLELQKDIVTGEITDYLVWHNEVPYSVNNATYDAIEKM